MSAAGRRRPRPSDPSDGQAPRPPVAATRVTAALALATLVSAAVVPVALLPDSPPPAAPPEQSREPAAGALRAAAPTDLIRGRQWYLNSLRVPKAWRWGRGRDITVAVLDTGVDGRHKDLTGQVVTGPDYTGRTRRPGGKYWGGHGTAMAGIIAGHGNGPGQSAGIMGIAPQAKILSIRVTWENDDPLRQSGSLAGRNRDAVAKGIRYAVDSGADIINMSLGGGRAFYNGNSTEEAAIRYALSKGVVLIASAGNDGTGPNRKNFPAAYPGVIAVGALDKRMRMWADTNRNSYVSVCAPGVDIISAAPGNRYVLGTGTSPSSAIVAGVAALIRSRYPRLTPEEVRQALIRGTVARTRGGTGTTGTGVCSRSLDAVRAVYAAHQINKTAHGGASAGTTRETAPPAPAAEPAAEDSDIVLWAILGGGGVLVVAGLVLGWRQRRRPEEDGAEPPFPEDPREPVAAMASGPGTERFGADGAEYADPPADPGWPPSSGTGRPHAPEPFADTGVPPAEPPWAEDGPPMYAAPVDPDPVTASTAWTPRQDLHLPPLDGTGNGFPGGNGHGLSDGNGNGHRTLDTGGLHPFDPSAAAAEPETTGFAAPFGHGPEAAGYDEGTTGCPDAGDDTLPPADASPGFVSPFHADPPGPGRHDEDPREAGSFADDPLGGGFSADDLPTTGFPAVDSLGAGFAANDPLGTGFSTGDPLGAGFSDDPLGTGPPENDPLGTGPVPPVADTPLAQESWRSVHEARAGEFSARTPDPDAMAVPEPVDPPYEEAQPGPAVDPGSVTSPFRAVEEQQISWRRPEDDPVVGEPASADDELETTTFSAVDPAPDAPDGGLRPEHADDDEHRPPWW